MGSGKVIRIDDEVWAELQRRARPFVDNPNMVLRTLLGLPTKEDAGRKDDGQVDSRVQELVEAVAAAIGASFHHRQLGEIHVLHDQRGKVYSYIRPQKKRLKISVDKNRAEEAGMVDFDGALSRGWFNASDSGYFYVPNDDKEAMRRAAKKLVRLWRTPRR